MCCQKLYSVVQHCCARVRVRGASAGACVGAGVGERHRGHVTRQGRLQRLSASFLTEQQQMHDAQLHVAGATWQRDRTLRRQRCQMLL